MPSPVFLYQFQGRLQEETENESGSTKEGADL